MNKTKIQWTDMSWNPIRARHPAGTQRVPGHYCEKISPGCALCYASRTQGRFGMPQFPGAGAKAKGQATAEPFLDEKKLTEPLRKRRGGRVFVCDMSDLFGEWVPFEWIDKVFAVMALTPQHTYQILTKRAGRMAEYMTQMHPDWDRAINSFPNERDIYVDGTHLTARRDHTDEYSTVAKVWPLPNVHLGVSAEDQKRYDEREPDLLRTPAAVRFLSAEPLLGPINFRWGGNVLDWVIVGGESGPGARPCNVEWVRSIVGQCKAAGVPVFVKQLGANVADNNTTSANHFPADQCWPDGTGTNYHRVLLKDPKGGDMAEWPEDLRVRELPSASVTA